MAKSKQQSAAQRREQVRQQRQQRQESNQKTQIRGSGNTRKRPTKNNPWFLIGGILLMVLVVIGIFIWLANQNSAQVKTGQDTTVKTITNLDPNLLSTVGAGSAQNIMHAVKGTALTGPHGKPEVFYAGGEYCPFCAAQRWAMIIALSRFGKFGPITPITSSEQNIPTFTFHGVQYSSQYIDFVAVETADNQNQPFDKLTEDQQALFSKYDSPPYVQANQQGSIPFIDIGNQYVSSGAYYQPDTLANHSYQDITTQLKDSNSDIARSMLGAANLLTAAICKSTNNNPSNVCTADPIPQIQGSLPKASLTPGQSQWTALATSSDMLAPRRD